MWRVNNAEPLFHYDFGVLISPFPTKGPILSILAKENIVRNTSIGIYSKINLIILCLMRFGF